jgi:hypothetical protein
MLAPPPSPPAENTSIFRTRENIALNETKAIFTEPEAQRPEAGRRPFSTAERLPVRVHQR